VHRKLVALAVGLSLFTVAASSAFAGGGNSSNAKLCQKQGWEGLQTDSGRTFTSDEDCTSYAANGGVFFTPSLTPTFRYCLGLNDQMYAFYDFAGSGFHPNSAVSFREPGQAFPFYTVTSDANGGVVLPGSVVYTPGPVGMTASDAQGVHAEISFTAVC